MKAVLLIVATLSILGIRVASGCSCGEPPPPLEALESADYVFWARPVAIDGIVQLMHRTADGWRPREPGTWSTGDLCRWRFEVVKAWKGVFEREVYMYTANGGASCGYSFEPGKEYIVYGRIRSTERMEGYLWPASETESLIGMVSLCSRTRPLWRAEDDFTDLPEPMQVWEAADAGSLAILWADGYKDGGTTAIAITDSLGTMIEFCYDGRLQTKTGGQMYIGARHPSFVGARLASPAEEVSVLNQLRLVIENNTVPEERAKLLHSDCPSTESRFERNKWMALHMLERYGQR